MHGHHAMHGRGAAAQRILYINIARAVSSAYRIELYAAQGGTSGGVAIADLSSFAAAVFLKNTPAPGSLNLD